MVLFRVSGHPEAWLWTLEAGRGMGGGHWPVFRPIPLFCSGQCLAARRLAKAAVYWYPAPCCFHSAAENIDHYCTANPPIPPPNTFTCPPHPLFLCQPFGWIPETSARSEAGILCTTGRLGCPFTSTHDRWPALAEMSAPQP